MGSLIAHLPRRIHDLVHQLRKAGFRWIARIQWEPPLSPRVAVPRPRYGGDPVIQHLSLDWKWVSKLPAGPPQWFADDALSDLQDALRFPPARGPRELHCARDVTGVIIIESPYSESQGLLDGVDVIVEESMLPGTWRLMQDGTIVDGGQLWCLHETK
jgi:hypothetical protein